MVEPVLPVVELVETRGFDKLNHRLGLRKRLPLADANGTVGRNVVPPSSFDPFLLAWGRDPGALCPVAPGAGGDEVLQAGGSALGPGVKVVAVLGGPGATAPESCLHFTQAGSPGHAFAALLARETSYPVPASEVLGVDDGSNDDQDHKKCARQGSRSQNAFQHSAQDLGYRGNPSPGNYRRLWHEGQEN